MNQKPLKFDRKYTASIHTNHTELCMVAQVGISQYMGSQGYSDLSEFCHRRETERGMNISRMNVRKFNGS